MHVSRAVCFAILTIVGLTSATSSESNDAVPSCQALGILVKSTIFYNESAIDDYKLTYASGDNQIIFMRTHGGELYKTTDEGDTWTKESIDSRMRDIEHYEGKVADIAFFRDLATGDALRIYFLGNDRGGTLPQFAWVTDNKGITYQQVTVPQGTYSIVPHHGRPEVALAHVHKQFGRSTKNLLHLTEDGGFNWRQLPGEFYNFEPVWGFPNGHPNRIYAILDTQLPPPQPVTRLVYSDDWFATTHVVHEDVWSLWLHNEDDMIIGKWHRPDPASPFASSRISLSTDSGATWSEADFPQDGDEDFAASAWYLYDLSENSIFIAEERDSTPPLKADLFKSHAFDGDFSLSMRQHVPNEFTKYESLEGVYVASLYNGTKIQSRITYNKGAYWLPLVRPEKQWDGLPYDCAHGNTQAGVVDYACGLHLHGYHSATGNSFFYSVPNAVGLMVAAGNVGDRVIVDKLHTNTYFSRDAGQTWEEVADGPFVPEFGDHGGVIVLADADDPINSITFWDGAMSPDLKKSVWKTCSFGNDKIHIQNVRVGPRWDSKQFLLHGTTFAGFGQRSHPVVVSVDFGPMLRKCTDADYELFAPHTETGACVLGVGTTYRRRKTGSRCWNGEEHERKTTTTKCTCTHDDFECDHCFTYDPETQRCMFDCFHVPSAVKALGLSPDVCNDDPSKMINVLLGWRKIDDDECDMSQPSSLKKPTGTVSCATWVKYDGPLGLAPHSNSTDPIGRDEHIPGPVIAVIVMIVVVVVAVVVYVLWTRNDRFRSLFGQVKSLGSRPAESGYEALKIVSTEDMEGDDDE